MLWLRKTNTARANYVVTYYKVKTNRKKYMKYCSISLKRYKDKNKLQHSSLRKVYSKLVVLVCLGLWQAFWS